MLSIWIAVEAVGRVIAGDLLIRERGDRGEQVILRDERVRQAGRHPPRPACDERHARATLEVVVLAAAQRPGGLVTAELFDGIVLLPVVKGGAVVTAQDDQRLAGELQPVQRGEDLAGANRPGEWRRRAAPSRFFPRSAGAARAARAGRAGRSICSSEGNVVRPGSMTGAALPGSTPVPYLHQAYSPVMSAYRDGVQVAAAEWPSVKCKPSFASRSMFGVFSRVAPSHDASPYPRSSR